MELRQLTPQLVTNKKVLVRVDFNVPLKQVGNNTVVADNNRIRQTLETIQFLQQHKAIVLLISHLGRPQGDSEENLSLECVATELANLLQTKVVFIHDCIGTETKKQVSLLQPGQVTVLENLRFYEGEKKNDREFTKDLASLADLYVNEAFSTAHRAHASIVGIPKYLPSYAGFAFAKEVTTFHQLMTKPKRPFVMIIGGAKISDKVSAIENLTTIADAVLVGGGVANNFLKADGFDIAKSYLQDAPADLKKQGIDYVDVAEELLEETKQDRLMIDGYIPLPKIVYPTDVLAAKNPESNTSQQVELINNNHEVAMQQNLMYLDIGPKTTHLFKEVILQAGTIFWNGPMGVFENKTFETGTKEVAMAVAKASATTILGGGDTIAAVRAFGLEDRFDYVSAAGGAALEFLSGKTLPGIEPLLKS